MRRYFRLLGLFVKSSLLTQLEYRANFLIQLMFSLFNVAAIVLTSTIFFTHRSSVGGWRFEEALVVTGLFVMMGGLISAVLEPNVQKLIEMIREGTLDFTLLKPVNAQFMVTTRHTRIIAFGPVIAGIGIAIYGLFSAGTLPSPGDLATFGLMLLCALVMLYSLWLIMATTSFWFIKVGNLTELFTTVFDTGRFPISTFKGAVRSGLTFVIPIAFLTTFPAQAVLGVLQPQWLLLAVLLACAFALAATGLWRRAIRSYSSASS